MPHQEKVATCSNFLKRGIIKNIFRNEMVENNNKLGETFFMKIRSTDNLDFVNPCLAADLGLYNSVDVSRSRV